MLKRTASGLRAQRTQSDAPRQAHAGLPPVGAEAGARQALHGFLAGFGIAAGDHRDQLTHQLLAGAHHHHRDHPQIGLAACAILHAEQQFEAWLGAILAPELASGQSALAAGRAAFLSCGGPTIWPELTLVHDPLPDGFVTAMRAAMAPLAPMPAPATMAPQTLESWSIGEAGRVALDLLGVTSGWAANARPLVTASIKLAKPWS